MKKFVIKTQIAFFIIIVDISMFMFAFGRHTLYDLLLMDIDKDWLIVGLVATIFIVTIVMVLIDVILDKLIGK